MLKITSNLIQNKEIPFSHSVAKYQLAGLGVPILNLQLATDCISGK
jgi:hypothetical protein